MYLSNLRERTFLFSMAAEHRQNLERYTNVGCSQPFISLIFIERTD